MKSFDQILPQFLANVKIRVKERAYSAYKGKSRVFSEWLAKNSFSGLPLAEINEQIIEQFSIYLANERRLDRPTCQKYMTLLKQIFQYGITRGDATKIPTDLFVLPQKGIDHSAQVISKEHNKILLDDIKAHDKQLYLACMTQFYTFLRPGKELRLLKVGDIDFERGTINVIQEHAKNGHKRTVTVPNQLVQILHELKIDTADKDLFVFGKGRKPAKEPCGQNVLTYRFRTYRKKHGFPDGYKLYSAKHTGASYLHHTGNVSMISLMNQLGHSNLASSQHYIHKIGGTVDEKIREGFPSPY
jgi:integrase